MSAILFTMGSQSIDANHVLAFMKLTGSYAHAKRTVVMNEIIREHALHSGITVSDEALQVYSDLRRIGLGLHSSADFTEYLDKIGISVDTWEKTLENELLRITVRQKLSANIFVVDAWKLIRGIPQVREHIAEALIARGREKGINVTAEEIQSASDTVRRVAGMHDAGDFRSILSALRMDEDDWERYLHSNIVMNGLGTEEQTDLFNKEIRAAINKYPVINALISDFVFGQLIHSRAKKLGMTVTDEEINAYVENFRRAFNLHSLKAFNIWLSASGMDLDQFEYIVRTELFRRKMTEHGLPDFDINVIEGGIKASAYFVNAFNSVRNFAALAETAKRKDFVVNDNDTNNESEYLRRAKKLHKSEDFQKFLSENNLSLELWAWYCECTGLIRKLYDHETSDEKLFAYINKNSNIKVNLKDALFNDIAISAGKTMSV